MKTVFNTSEIAHKFAHKYPEGHNPGKSFYFRDGILFSYRDSFPVAAHVSKGGRDAVLITTREHSVTTSRHTHKALAACSHLSIIRCREILAPSQGDHGANLSDWSEQIAYLLKLASRSPKPEAHLSKIRDLQGEIGKYIEFFGISGKYPLLFSKVEGKEGAQWALAEYDAEKKLESERVDRVHRENFRNFHSPSYWSPIDPNLTLLRLNKIEKKVETSKGITFPLPVALRIVSTLEGIKGDPAKIATCKILDYQVSDCNKDYVLIGCHKLLWTEIRAMVKAIKALDV